MVKRVKRYEVWLINLDPTVGSELRKTRPAVVLSPDAINSNLRTVIVAPMTTVKKNWPTRVALTFSGKKGFVVLDQIRTVDKDRLVKRLGRIEKCTIEKVHRAIVELFAQ